MGLPLSCISPCHDHVSHIVQYKWWPTRLELLIVKILWPLAPTRELLPPPPQTMVAQSVLELPPIITRQGRPLAFLHPCLSAGLSLSSAGSPKPLPTSKISGNRVFLDLRCSFEGSTDRSTSRDKSERQHPEACNVLAGASRETMPRVVPSVRQGGVLCFQVRGLSYSTPVDRVTSTKLRDVLYV